MVEYRQLEPSSLTALVDNVPTFDGSNLSFYDTSSFIYTLFFVAIVGAAFYQYVLVGIYRMQASESGIRKSNETFKRTTLGLLGVFGLFLIIFTLNKSLLTGDVGLDGLKTESTPGAETKSESTPTPVPSGSTPPIPSKNDDPVGWDAIKNDAIVRSQLASLPNGGVIVNKNVCTEPTQTSCTTVGGLPQESISMLSLLRQTCGGKIAITGGTEAGHKSHGPGKPPVDISLNDDTLASCIRNFPIGPTKSYCKKTFVNFGYVFCDENLGVPHWHVEKQK